MGKISGFLEFPRLEPDKREVGERVRDFREFELPVLNEKLREQGARCMDCGIPFCNVGCPLGNLIPDFNHHVYEGRWEDAARALALTNNFPEITGRVCPAPCEAACVLGIDDTPVSIKLADRSFESGAFAPQPPPSESGKSVAVIGSGPAGMAAAQELRRRGHRVVLFEKADRIGGLLTYGIPDFKLEKSWVQARVEQMAAEGVELETGVDIGRDFGVERL
jgi:glutamate synthase (NADPH/NADH) small chain